MLLERLESKEGFTNSERQIADYILKNPIKIQNLTATELGSKSYTSKATVLRLCQKLDLSGYSDLRVTLTKEISEKDRLNQLIKDEPINQHSTLDDIYTALPSIYDRAISETKLRWHQQDLERALAVMNQVDMIDIYGVGITYSCALAASFKYQSIGIESNALSAINEHNIKFHQRKKRVAILLSFTGGNIQMLSIGRYLRRNGIHIIGIGGQKSTALKEICHEYIVIDDKNHVFNIESIGTYTAMTFVLDVMYLDLMSKNYEENLTSSIEVYKDH